MTEYSAKDLTEPDPVRLYEFMVANYYPDHIDEKIARRMLQLEQVVFTDLDRQSLVPSEFDYLRQGPTTGPSA